MKTVVEIVAAVVLFISGASIAPKAVMEFKKEVIKKVNQGLSPMTHLSKKLTHKF